jgi:hypothetical protein
MYRTWWDVVLHNWPMTIFVPAILLVLAVLAVVTRIMDGVDASRAAKTDGGTTRSGGAPARPSAGPPPATGSSTAAAPLPAEAPTPAAVPDVWAEDAADGTPDVAVGVVAAGGDGDAHAHADADRTADEPGDQPDPGASQRPSPAVLERAESAAPGSTSHR